MKTKAITTIMLTLFLAGMLLVAPVHTSLGTNNGLTSLSLEPSVIKVPFLELEHAAVIISVDLDIYNVHNLKKFHLSLTFDNKMLEFYTDKAGDWGYSGSLSISGYQKDGIRISGELSAGREISGSGTFLRFAFKVLSIGSSQILMKDTELIDVDGNTIPHVVSNNIVEVQVGRPELSAEVSGQETLDSTGAPKTSFALGETVLVSAEVTNVGNVSQPMLIVVQLMDPDLRALAPTYISMTVPVGLSITPSLGFMIPLTGYAAGTWTAKVMVLDTWPALGGVPIAEPVTVEFTVTS